jgi:hypothetical protein
MGNQPTKLDEISERAVRLKSTVDEMCLEAAKAIKCGDILLVTVGDDIDYIEHGLTWNASNLERFYGHWGDVFNNIRKAPLHEALNIIDQWRQKWYYDNDTDKQLQELLEEKVDVCWKKQLASSLTNEVINLDDDGESDDEEIVNLQFESFAPERAGAFYVYTSSQTGSAARLWGQHIVRECRGSIQQFQCGREGGPCRDQNVWEAPDGFSFTISQNDKGEPVAPVGLPKSRPPVFKVNMHNPVCMDRALSVAAAFRTNHPICRSCSGPARPALSLKPGDIDWIDVEERAVRYSKWRRAVKAISLSQGKKVIVIEIGGSPPQHSSNTSQHDLRTDSTLLWTTVRQESESIIADINISHQSEEDRGATLIRINNSFPLSDGSNDRDSIEKSTISIMLSPVEALQKIDFYLNKMRS